MHLLSGHLESCGVVGSMEGMLTRAAGFTDAFAGALVSDESTPAFAFLEADGGTGEARLILVLASPLAVRPAAIPLFAQTADIAWRRTSLRRRRI